MRNEKQGNNKRKFLKKSIVIGAISTVAPQFFNSHFLFKNSVSKGGEAYTFLFQGDSITDGNRTRNNELNHRMGHGYQYIITSNLVRTSKERLSLF
ncbi:MAG: hypothetical protein ABIO05_00330 [Ferruginibacter sp.]